jgi:hypothetical protein
VTFADKRAHHGGAADLVVVAADDVFLGRDVGVREERQQRGGWVVALRVSRSRVRTGAGQHGGHRTLGAAVVQEVRVELEHRELATADPQHAVAGERTQADRLDTVASHSPRAWLAR